MASNVPSHWDVTSVTSHPHYGSQPHHHPGPPHHVWLSFVVINKTMDGHVDSTLNECDTMGWCDQNNPPHSHDQDRLSVSSSPPHLLP